MGHPHVNVYALTEINMIDTKFDKTLNMTLAVVILTLLFLSNQ